MALTGAPSKQNKAACNQPAGDVVFCHLPFDRMKMEVDLKFKEYNVLFYSYNHFGYAMDIFQIAHVQ